MTLEKKEIYNVLFSYYENLLTTKQIEYFKLYFFLDYSFKEISENKNVSRNAIFLSVKETVSLLEEYESKLHLLEIHNLRIDLISKLNYENISIIKEQLLLLEEK
ncbi:MAG: hypothetical protein LBV51_03570 [Acholeplasmatales bacterium]|jgi:predicted DNA-binding protein YlxM (UPF0122 family)|nr:hypothetical protein [Acholeplasmatales bacterium]